MTAGSRPGVLPSGVVTFLFTDIEGSTRRWENDAEQMRAALAAHDDVLRTAIEAQGGRVFKHTGDGVCAVFTSPSAAVEAATSAQQLLELPVRMGISTGEAELRGSDYFGAVLNRAARLMAVGHGGQILVDGQTAGLLHGVDLVDLGARRLRDLSAPVGVFQVRAEGLRAEFPPLRALDVPLGNLRPAASSLIGRDAELVEVAAAVCEHRVVTLTGVSMSKTATGRHHPRPRRRQPYAWLGAGALAVGFGAALAHGSAVAHADESPASAGPPSSARNSSGSLGKASPARTAASTQAINAGKSFSAAAHTNQLVASLQPTRTGATSPHPSQLLPSASRVAPPRGSGTSAPPAASGTVRPVEAGSRLVDLGTLTTAATTASTATTTPSSVAKTVVAAKQSAPTVGSPDPTTGVVTGSLGLSASTGKAITVSQPARGAVTVANNGTFIYTPTLTARQAAGAATTDTFTATVRTWFIFSKSVTVTVPVDPGTPVAGTPTVGTPNPTTGVVTGTAVFTDTAGRTLTYSAPATSTGGGTVSINTKTGAFTYTPTQDQLHAVTTDSFTVTASNGVRSAGETITITTGSIVPLPQTYKTFDGAKLNLYMYQGTKTAILASSPSLDAATMQKWLNAMDGTYNFYKLATGQDPSYNTNVTYISGRSTIARVDQTCGAGCGYLGSTGIEMLNTYFDNFYTRLKNDNQYDQIPFYEFGRNCWFYGDKLAYKANDPITTGYAVFMRFMAMDSLGLDGAPFNGTLPFNDFESQIRNLRTQYLADTSLDWSNTLGVGQGVPDTWGATDLFASFCFYLKDTYGMQWVLNVWKDAAARPDALTTQDAVDNFIIAASQAANTNLVPLFQSWRWPVSQSAITYIGSLKLAS